MFQTLIPNLHLDAPEVPQFSQGQIGPQHSSPHPVHSTPKLLSLSQSLLNPSKPLHPRRNPGHRGLVLLCEGSSMTLFTQRDTANSTSPTLPPTRAPPCVFWGFGMRVRGVSLNMPCSFSLCALMKCPFIFIVFFSSFRLFPNFIA